MGLAIAALALVPLAYVLYSSATAGPDVIWDQLVRPRIGLLLRNTVLLVVGGVLLSSTIAIACAWLVVRTDLPAARIWHALLVAPLAIPAFVNGYAWVSLTHNVEGFAGAVMIVSLSYFPLIYLPAVATLRGLDPALEETARTLGLSQVAIFFRVVLPQLRPALFGGGLLVALHLLAEFGALQQLRFPTLTTALFDQFGNSFSGVGTQLMASVLILLCLVVLVLELRLRGQRRYERLGGAPHEPQRHHLGRWRAVAVAAPLVVVALALVVPLSSMTRWMLVGSSTTFPLGELAATTASTLALAAAGAVVAIVVGVPVALLVVRFPSRMSTLVERSTFTANSLPGIVIALALITVTITYTPVIYQTIVVLIGAYVVMYLSRAVVSIRAGLEQSPAVLEDVAHSLGSSRSEAFRRVTLPLVMPSIGAGAALVFIAIATELTATLLLAPIGTRTLATQFWSESSSLAYGAAAPYAFLLVLLSIPATLLLVRTVKAR